MTKRDKILLAVLAIILVIAAIIILIFIPTQNRISTLESQISSANSRISTLDSEIMVLNALTAERDSLRAVLDYIDDMEQTYVPLYFDPFDKMRLMQRVLYPHTTRISLGFDEPELLEGTYDIYVSTLRLAFSSSFHDVLDILYALLNDGPPHRVVTYNITHTLPMAGTWFFDYDEETYFFHEEIFGVFMVRMDIEYLTRVPRRVIYQENGD